MTSTRLSDGDREILAELEWDARPSAGDLDDLLESADCLEDVLGELLDDAYGSDDRETVSDPGELCDDSEYPY